MAGLCKRPGRRERKAASLEELKKVLRTLTVQQGPGEIVVALKLPEEDLDRVHAVELGRLVALLRQHLQRNGRRTKRGAVRRRRTSARVDRHERGPTVVQWTLEREHDAATRIEREPGVGDR